MYVSAENPGGTQALRCRPDDVVSTCGVAMIDSPHSAEIEGGNQFAVCRGNVWRAGFTSAKRVTHLFCVAPQPCICSGREPSNRVVKARKQMQHFKLGQEPP